MTRHNTSSGFALLMTLLVVSVVVSITLAVIELSIKQLNLSVSAKDSEIAFHAANAGMECVRYTLRTEASDFDSPGDWVPLNCFNKTGLRLNNASVDSGVSSDSAVSQYTARVTWPTNDRCSEIDVLRVAVPEGELAVVVRNLGRIFSGKASTDSKSCPSGSICTIAEVVGYNKPCSNITDPGTVRREILLEF